jgi:hypothetical protein
LNKNKLNIRDSDLDLLRKKFDVERNDEIFYNEFIDATERFLKGKHFLMNFL